MNLKHIYITIITITLTACSFTKTNHSTQKLINNTNKTQPNNRTNTLTVTTPTNVNSAAYAAQKIPFKYSIYFDFNSFNVKNEFYSIIEEHAKYILHNKIHHVLVQGNTDDRGSAEYNLALGQKRAEAVRKSLILLGVPAKYIEAISFGKEKPKSFGKNEVSRAENRRTDFNYQQN